MNRIGTALTALGLGALMMACGPGMTTPDADMGDSSMMPTDASGDSSMMSGARVCDEANIVDLATAGMRMGTRTTYTGTTAMAAGTTMIAAPTDCVSEMYMPIRQVAHKYRMNAAGYLRVSTAVAATPSGEMNAHDTAVWMQSACDTRGTMSFGCNDDGEGSLASTATSNRLLAAGTEVTIVVATVSMMANGPGAAYGLQIDELPPVAAGGVCDTSLDVDTCAEGNTCLYDRMMDRATCTANGTRFATRCRTGNMCDSGLTCVPGEDGAPSYCYRAGTLNMACSFEETQCPTGSSCVLNGPTDVFNGICRTDGTRGGLCNSMTACAMGTTCSATGDNTGVCRTTAMAGGECDAIASMTACPMTAQCVPAGMMGTTATMFTCAAAGTAAGTDCRDAAPRCDTGLTCSSTAGPGHCTREVAAGAECDALYGTTNCASMQACRRTAIGTAGTCVMPTAEPTTDNNAPMMAGAPLTLPATVRGSLNTADDVDCYAITVPAAGGSVFASIGDGAGGCPSATRTVEGMPPMAVAGDTQLFLVNSMNQVVADNDDSILDLCSTIDGANAASPAHNIAGGNYFLCLRSYQGSQSIASYTLNVAVTPRM